MFKLRKLNNHGVAHHAVMMAVIVLAVGGFGLKTVLASHADALNTADYTVSVYSEDGCWLAGRVWNANATPKCAASCRAAGTTYNANGTNPGFCSGQIAPNSASNADECVQNLHRMFVKNVGCARKGDQDSSNDSRRCTGWSGNKNYTNVSGTAIPISGFPNYVVDNSGSTDKCIAATIVTPTPAPGPMPTGPTTQPANTDSISDTYCALLGRKGTNGICQRTCALASATLLATADGVDYCNSSIAGMTPANCSKAFRVYVTVNGHNVGCARRPDQQSSSDKLRCMTNAGYDYYVADKTGLDFCVKSGTPLINFPNPLNPSDVVTQPSSTSSNGTSGDNGNQTPPTKPVTEPQAGAGQTVSVEAINTKLCDLLGREWVPASKDSHGVKQAAGCSLESCFRSKIDIVKSNGSAYCDGYATTSISQDTCTNQLHRKWLGTVNACASRPNQNDKPGTHVVQAAQCIGGYSTYVFRTAQYDECLKPGTVDDIKNVARLSGVPFVKLTTMSRAGLCNVLPHKHWNGHACVQDRQIQPGGSTTPTVPDTTPPRGGVTSAFCSNLHRPFANGKCGDCTLKGYPYRWVNPNPAGFDKCYPSKAQSPDANNNDANTGNSNYCSNPDHAAQCQTDNTTVVPQITVNGRSSKNGGKLTFNLGQQPVVLHIHVDSGKWAWCTNPADIQSDLSPACTPIASSTKYGDGFIWFQPRY